MFSHGVLVSNELDASNALRPGDSSVDRNTGVGSLRRFRRDGRIVVIKTEWYGMVRDVVTFGPINQRVPNPIVFGESCRNVGVGAHMHDGQKVGRAEPFEFHFGQTATIATK